MTVLKFGVIGCGQIGRRHLAAIAQEPRAALVALCDTDPAALSRSGEAFPDAAAYDDPHALIASPDVEIVSICAPHRQHPALSIAAVEAGKHVLVEKPMALTVADSRAMTEAARANGVKLVVVKQNRFNAPVRHVRRVLEEGRLGRIFMVQANVFWNRYRGYYADSPWRGSRAEEGGALHTQVSHFLDLMVWWLGPVADARTMLATLHHHIEIEDCGVSALRFESGALGSLNWSTAVYNVNYEGSITLIGETGTIKVGGKYLNEIVHWDVASTPQPAPDTEPERPNDYGAYVGTSANHGRLFEEVAQHIITARSGIVEGEEGVACIEAIERIYAGAG
ncbi:Gfo/Idh/MocA family protein [Acuticoccus sp.]|uniref:Gfo/Idh/MocA family protein n=1 Tax=Acuticoccus sp. TaxID=1904378 RepID=UPI003B52A62C